MCCCTYVAHFGHPLYQTLNQKLEVELNMTRLGVEQKLAVPINGRNCKHGSGRYGKMKIYMLARACVSFPTRNHRALACVTHEQTHTHAHMYKEHTYSVYTYTSLPHMRSSVHTYSSGLHTLSSVRSCKTEERSKRLLLPCCCPLQQRSTIADTGFPLYCSALAPRKAIP